MYNSVRSGIYCIPCQLPMSPTSSVGSFGGRPSGPPAEEGPKRDMVWTTSWMSERRWSSATRAWVTEAAWRHLFSGRRGRKSAREGQNISERESGTQVETHIERWEPSTVMVLESSFGRSGRSTSMTRLTSVAFSGEGNGSESELFGGRSRHRVSEG